MSLDSIYTAFGQGVATRRKALNLTQAELAGRVNMSRASIANIEKGRQNILLHHVYALAAALECKQVSDLLPPPPLQKTSTGGLTMSRLNDRLSASAEAQLHELITSAFGQRRNPRSGS